MTGRVWRLLTVVALVAVTAGCGIAADAEPHAVEPPAPYRDFGTPSTTAPPETRAAGPLTESIYLTRDNRLAHVPRSVDEVPSVSDLLDHLTAGPTAEESEQGYSTALVAGADVVEGVDVENGQAEVALAPGWDDGVAPALRILAVAQIVCTLDAHLDVSRVVFTIEGQRATVPRGNAQRTPDPVTADDYAELLEPSADGSPQ